MGFKAKAKPKQPNPNPKPKAAKRKDYYMEISDLSDPDHYRQYILYCQRLEECGPFDLDFVPDSSVVIFGLISINRYEDFREKVDKCVRHAIAYAKKEKKMKLEDPKVINANLRLHTGTMYYITFDAKDKRSGKRQVYNAKVEYLRGNRGIDGAAYQGEEFSEEVQRFLKSECAYFNQPAVYSKDPPRQNQQLRT